MKGKNEIKGLSFSVCYDVEVSDCAMPPQVLKALKEIYEAKDEEDEDNEEALTLSMNSADKREREVLGWLLYNFPVRPEYDPTCIIDEADFGDDEEEEV